MGVFNPFYDCVIVRGMSNLLILLRVDVFVTNITLIGQNPAPRA
jgi:hypothetical protein